MWTKIQTNHSCYAVPFHGMVENWCYFSNGIAVEDFAELRFHCDWPCLCYCYSCYLTVDKSEAVADVILADDDVQTPMGFDSEAVCCRCRCCQTVYCASDNFDYYEWTNSLHSILFALHFLFRDYSSLDFSSSSPKLMRS